MSGGLGSRSDRQRGGFNGRSLTGQRAPGFLKWFPRRRRSRVHCRLAHDPPAFRRNWRRRAAL